MNFRCTYCGSSDYGRKAKRGSMVKCSNCGKWGILGKQQQSNDGDKSKPASEGEKEGGKAKASAPAKTVTASSRAGGERAGKSARPGKARTPRGAGKPVSDATGAKPGGGFFAGLLGKLRELEI